MRFKTNSFHWQVKLYAPYLMSFDFSFDVFRTRFSGAHFRVFSLVVPFLALDIHQEESNKEAEPSKISNGIHGILTCIGKVEMIPFIAPISIDQMGEKVDRS